MPGNRQLKSSERSRTIAVIGAGPAGLFAAHLAKRAGFRVALFESHSKPGGCASYFKRKTPVGEAVFDAGATVLSDLGPNGLLRALLEDFGVEAPAFRPMRHMSYRIRNRAFQLDCADTRSWIESLAQAFPEDSRAILAEFPGLALHAQRLHRALKDVPHLPLTSFQDLRLNAPLAGTILPELGMFLRGHFKSFGSLLEDWELHADFKLWIDMNLLITLQAPASEVHPLWGAMALFFYPLGAGSLQGGMKSLFEPLLKKLTESPDVRVFMRCPVQKILRRGANDFVIRASETDYGPFDAVISSVPRYNLKLLADFPVLGPRWDFSRLQKHLWGAVTSYLVVEDIPDFPKEAFHVHSSEVGEVYFSFSGRDEPGRAPRGYRTVTLSTHAKLRDWPEFSGYRQDKDYLAHKNAAGSSLTDHFNDLFPGSKIIFREHGTPNTFARYTRRQGGGVGGLPLDSRFTGFLAPSQRTLDPSVFQIGDTSFPGQSVFGCAIGALAVIEKLTGRKRSI